MGSSPYQNPPVGAPESALLPGMSASEVEGRAASALPQTGGFPNITDSSLPGLQQTEEPGSWVYDFDPGSGSARATFNGIVSFTSGGSATAGVTSFNTRTGAITLLGADVTAAGGIVNPSAALTGVPTAPTAAAGTATTQLATTAFVAQAITASAGVVTFNGRNGAVVLSTSDITSAGGAALASPAFTGNPTAPTQAVTDSSSNLATTAFVSQWGAQNSVLSFNGRRGAVTLQLTDVTSVGGAPLASPNFTGVPAGPTAAAGTATTQLATTAFVENAVTAASTGVVSFNGRGGVVTLQTADVVNAGGAPSVSPQLTGTPVAPTAAGGTNTNQIATTAFVENAITTMAPIVTTFNGRSGAVALALADVTGVGGAPLASPALSGTPTSTTPTAGDNSTRIATTAFLATALGNYVTQTSLTGQLAAYLPLSGGTLANPTSPVLTINGTAAGALAIPLNVQNTSTSSGSTAGVRIGAGLVWAPTDGTSVLNLGAAPSGTNLTTVTVSANSLVVNGSLSAINGTFSGAISTTGSATVGGALGAPSATIGGVVFPGGSPAGSLNMPGTGTLNIASGGRIMAPGVGSQIGSILIGTTGLGPQFLTPNADNIGAVGFPNSAWNNMYAYAYTTQSDPRLKKDTAALPAGALSKVLAVPVIQFRWLAEAESDPLHTGFDASQVMAQLPPPTVSVGGDENQTLGLNTVEMIAWLWAAVQELAQKANVT